jgi:DNA-directed RNA polymerase specialized sigma24 family protein
MRTGGGGTGDSRQDVLLYRFYRQVARRHAARLGTGDDIAADAHRSGGWLGGRTPSPGEILAGPRGKHVSIPERRADRDADRAVAALYGQHYAALVRLASLLVGDAGTAEEIVQDSFVALHASRRRLRSGDGALSYLRRSVLHRSHSAVWSRTTAEPKAPGQVPEGPAGPRPSAAPGSPAVISALRALPARQREAVVMRYYAGLSEARVAEVMGISRRSARRHTERAMAALRTVPGTGITPVG